MMEIKKRIKGSALQFEELVAIHRYVIKNFGLTEQERTRHDQQMENLLSGIYPEMAVYRAYVQDLYRERAQGGWEIEQGEATAPE